MNRSKLRSPAGIAASAGSLFPALVIVLFYMFVLRARIHLGRWPLPYRPDPKDLGFDFHDAAIACGFISVVPVAFATLLHLIKLKHSGRMVRDKVVAYSVCLALIILWGWIDPGNFIEWYLD